MASLFSLSPTPLCHTLRTGEIADKLKSGASAYHIANNVKREQSYCAFTRGYLAYGSTLKNHSYTSQVGQSRLLLSRALSSTVSTQTDPDQTDCEKQALVVPTYSSEVAFNRVNCLVWVLHESASSFSLSIEALKLTRKDPELAMAWVGVDAQAWHKHVSYQVAVYALLKAVIEVLIPSHKQNNHPSLVQEILPKMTILLGESIESQLNMKQPQLVEWFRTVELPRIAGVFISLFKKWGMDYAGSGVAGIILAISCCSAAKRIGSARFSNPSFSVSIEDILVELMDLSQSLVSVDNLHHLAIEAGFEEDFLKHFGRKVLPGKDIEEVEFWIGLVQRKLSTAFHRESVILGKQNFNDEVQLKGLVTLGLFAFLGRETRLFLSGMGVKNLDEQVKDFLSYLECGSLFMYPEFSSLSEYQLFMEVVTDEIGWLDFYAAFSGTFSEERRRLKHDGFQAEQELILCIVYTVCYDVFSGFAHFSNSAKRQLDAKLLDFLLRSQSLLSTCLEDYWVSYDKSGELLGIADKATPDSSLSPETTRRTNSSALLEAYRLQIDIVKSDSHQQGSKLSKWQIGHLTNMDPEMHQEVGLAAESESLARKLIRKSATKLRSASSDVWMGSQLLFVDILDAMGYLMKRIQGLRITKRERTKTQRTLTDLASLVPITILMLIPISPVGHAALLAAIQKYTPWMIPSPYSPERLDVVKQLRRAKKMEVLTTSTTNLSGDASS